MHNTWRVPYGRGADYEGLKLPAKYVIHAVGPKYWDGTRNEAALLRSCYKSIFRIAGERKLSSIAIPALGTGIYRFPIKEATAIAVEEAEVAIDASSIKIVFCCFDKHALDVYNFALQK